MCFNITAIETTVGRWPYREVTTRLDLTVHLKLCFSTQGGGGGIKACQIWEYKIKFTEED